MGQVVGNLALAPVRETPAAQARPDMYALVHKGLRTYMCDTLARLGRLDAGHPQEVQRALAAVRALVEAVATHLRLERRFIHSAMERRAPGSARSAEEEHRVHERTLARLEAAALEAAQAGTEERAAALAGLYRRLALFVAEQLPHMDAEEADGNAVLHATHSDAELAALQQELLAALPADKLMGYLQWLLPALAPHERVQLLAKLKKAVMPEEYAGVFLAARDALPERDWSRLCAAL